MKKQAEPGMARSLSKAIVEACLALRPPDKPRDEAPSREKRTKKSKPRKPRGSA